MFQTSHITEWPGLFWLEDLNYFRSNLFFSLYSTILLLGIKRCLYWIRINLCLYCFRIAGIVNKLIVETRLKANLNYTMIWSCYKHVVLDCFLVFTFLTCTLRWFSTIRALFGTLIYSHILLFQFTVQNAMLLINNITFYKGHDNDVSIPVAVRRLRMVSNQCFRVSKPLQQWSRIYYRY